MTHLEVKNYLSQINSLMDYIKEENIKNITLSYALQRNLERLIKSDADFMKCADPELLEIEEKVKGLADDFKEGLSLLTAEERLRRDVLVKKFFEDMQGEADVELFKVDLNDIKHLEIGIEYSYLLSKLIK